MRKALNLVTKCPNWQHWQTYTQSIMTCGSLPPAGWEPIPELLELFQTEFALRLFWGQTGAKADRKERYAKFDKILTVLSNKLEPDGSTEVWPRQQPLLANTGTEPLNEWTHIWFIFRLQYMFKKTRKTLQTKAQSDNKRLLDMMPLLRWSWCSYCKIQCFDNIQFVYSDDDNDVLKLWLCSHLSEMCQIYMLNYRGTLSLTWNISDSLHVKNIF